MFTQNNSHDIRKIQIKKVNDNPAELMYSNNDHTIYRKLNNSEFTQLFERIRPSIDFSLPDRLIQDLVHDNQFIPKFIESRNYTTDDLKETIKEGNVLTSFEKLSEKREKNKREKIRNLVHQGRHSESQEKCQRWNDLNVKWQLKLISQKIKQEVKVAVKNKNEKHESSD